MPKETGLFCQKLRIVENNHSKTNLPGASLFLDLDTFLVNLVD